MFPLYIHYLKFAFYVEKEVKVSFLKGLVEIWTLSIFQLVVRSGITSPRLRLGEQKDSNIRHF